MKNVALVLAGGIGNRMKSAHCPKQYIMIKDRPVMDYTLRTLEEHPMIDGIFIVADPTWHTFIDEWIEKSDISKFIGYTSQGDTRQFSIFNGLRAMGRVASTTENVLVTDSVRPLLPPSLITSCLEHLAEVPCVMPVLPVKDTCYQSTDGKQVANFISRNQLFAGQAPEGFHYRPYLELHQNLTYKEIFPISGSTEIAYKNGWEVKMIPGAEINFKITTPEDLVMFEKMLE